MKLKTFLLFILFICNLSCKKSSNYSAEELDEVFRTINSDIEKNSSTKDDKFYKNELLKGGAYQDFHIQAYLHGLLGVYYFQEGQLELSNQELTKLEIELSSTNTIDLIAYQIYAKLGGEFYINSNDRKASKYLDKALAIAANIEDFPITKDYIVTLRLAADEAYILNRFEESVALSNLALKHLPDLNLDENFNKILTFDSYYSLFNGLYTKYELTKEATESNQLKDLIEKAEKLDVSVRKQYLYDMKADYYSLIKDHKTETGYRIKNFKLAQKANEQEPNPIFEENLYRATLNLIESYLKNNEPLKAEPYFKLLEKSSIYVKNNDPAAKEMIYEQANTICMFYFKNKDYKKLEQCLENLNYSHKRSIINISNDTESLEKAKQDYALQNEKRSIVQFEQKSKIQKGFSLLFLGLLITSLAAGYLLYKLYKAEQKERKTAENLNKTKTDLLQQKMLLTQMEPHFVFNSLNSLKSLINLNQKDESIEFITDFSHLLRTSIEQSREDFVLLKTEIDTIKSYVNIHQLKDKPFKFHLEINEQIKESEILIPPMLLQPFVENSIIHGIQPLTEREGVIKICLEPASAKSILISIIDNGVGLKKPLTETKTNKSYAIQIAKERLELLQEFTKTKTNFTLKNNSGEGVSVILEVPFKQKSL